MSKVSDEAGKADAMNTADVSGRRAAGREMSAPRAALGGGRLSPFQGSDVGVAGTQGSRPGLSAVAPSGLAKSRREIAEMDAEDDRKMILAEMQFEESKRVGRREAKRKAAMWERVR